jgi:uncharacterized protein YkwD
MRRRGGTAGQRLVVAIAALAATVALAATAAQADYYDTLLAPGSVCPKQRDITLPLRTQKAAMRCLHRYARQQAQVPQVSANAELQQAAQAKAGDIMRCQQFSHTACGNERFYWPNKTGYTSTGCYALAENIAWGTDGNGSAHAVMRAWLHSDQHRRFILRRRFRDIGVGLKHGTFKGKPNSQVWVVILGRQYQPGTC